MKRTPLKRKTPLQRGGPIQRRTPMKYDWRRTKARQLARQVKALIFRHSACPPPAREVDEDYLAWIRKQRCIISDRYGVDAAHMDSVGSGGSDYNCLPLKRRYHAEQHNSGIKTFADSRNLDIAALIAENNHRYTMKTGREIHRRNQRTDHDGH